MRVRLEDTTAGLRQLGRQLVRRLDRVQNYLDNILTYCADFRRHLALIEAVLARLQGAGLSVNFVKSKRCCASLEFVGMVVDRQGMRRAESKIAAVAELSAPTTVE